MSFYDSSRSELLISNSLVYQELMEIYYSDKSVQDKQILLEEYLLSTAQSKFYKNMIAIKNQM